jgi:hypothetical protein
MASFADNKRKAEPSAFVAGALAPEAPSNRLQRGENNHAEVSRFGLGDDLLFLFDKSVRGVTFDELRSMAESVLNSAKTLEDEAARFQAVEDLYVLAFQTRWSRGGKGERQIFYSLVNILMTKFPDATLELVPLLPHYGYWKDLLLIVKECAVTNKINDDATLERLKAVVFSAFAEQLAKDTAELVRAKAAPATDGEGNAVHPNLTFCAKFAPSENKEFDKLFGATLAIAKLFTPDASTNSAAIKPYRKACADLRAALEVPEVKTCANRWSEIDFNRVTSLCMNRKMKAFLNEKTKTTHLASKYAETGDRHPDDEDRVQSRKNLLEALVSKGAIKGKDLFPHELVKQCMHKQVTTAEGSIINAQYLAMKEGVLKMIEDRKLALEEATEIAAETTANSAAIDLGKIVCMSDVSGSMSGTPMEVSIAMGLLISEISHPAFRDLVMMFHENPQWHDLSKCTSFVDKVQSLMRGSWGGSTNFEGAMNLIAAVVEKQRLKQEDIPTLMVVSDMQFDYASGGYDGYRGYGGGRSSGWNTASQNIKKLFHDLGVKMWGKPFDAPLIVFWNVRSGTTGTPAAADEEGVVMLSGYSPSLMKFVLSGEMAEVVEDIVVDEETGEVSKVTRQITPAEALRKVLDDEGLEPVRDALRGKDLSM